jgi:hypothetical protein
MGRLTLFERIRVINLFNQLEIGCKNKYKHVSNLANSKLGIEISGLGVRRLVEKWLNNRKLADKLRSNKDKLLISNSGMLALNKALLENSSLTRRKLKQDLNLVASTRTISRALQQMGWRKVATKYCQIIRPVNRLKRFIYACLSKRFKDDLDDAIVVDNNHQKAYLLAFWWLLIEVNTIDSYMLKELNSIFHIYFRIN